jgi:PKD repeat protein
MFPQIVDWYSPWGKNRVKPLWELAEEEALISRLLHEQAISTAESQTTTVVTVAAGFKEPQYWHPSMSADFTSQTVGYGPLTVTFQNISSRDSTLYGNYIWRMGPYTSKDTHATATFDTGSYDVTLTIIDRRTNLTASTITKTSYLTVLPPVVSCSILADRQSGNIPVEVSFSNLSQNALQYSWSFGDNTSSLFPNPTHSFNSGSLYSVTLTVTGQYNITASTTMNISASVGVDLASEMSKSFNTMISGLTASAATYDLYSTASDASHSYIRNTNLWASNVDWSCIPAYGGSGTSFNGVLLAPDILLQAAHAHAGGTLYFVDASNNVFSSSVVSGSTLNVTGSKIDWREDIYLSRLYPPLPDNIKPAKLLPLNSFSGSYVNLLQSVITGSNSIPVAHTNQFRTLKMKTLNGLSNNSVITVNFPTTGSPLFPWHSPVIGGDSGSPFFLIIDNMPVVLGVWYLSFGSPNICNFMDEVNFVISTSLNSTCSLSTMSLDKYNLYHQ